LQLYINKNYPKVTHINQLSKNIVVQFLNHVLQRTSARSRNNYRLELSSLMQALEDNEIVVSNIVKKIPVLKAIPERNKTYTKETQEEIFKFLETKDPILLLYIKFISYNFLRPIEVNRLKVGDLNLIDKTIQFRAKNSALKTKIIPEILLEELPDLSNMNKDNPLFAPNQLGSVWDATVQNRRDHFSKRFKKVVKEPFNLGIDYGLYSFRHTYITKLYKELVKDSSPFAAKSKLMQITGHSSMTALEKYLRDIDAALPADYSNLLRE
jgi:integrase